MQTAPAIVRVKTPRSVMRTPRTQANSLLPLLVPASVAAAGILWGLLRAKRRTAVSAPIELNVSPPVEISATVVALVHRTLEFL